MKLVSSDDYISEGQLIADRIGLLNSKAVNALNESERGMLLEYESARAIGAKCHSASNDI